MRLIPYLTALAPALALVLGASLLLTACGGDDGGGSAEPAIAGKWSLDTEAFLALLTAEIDKTAEGDDEAAAMAKMMKGPMLAQFKDARMDFDIQADGTWTMDGEMGDEKGTAAGTWKKSGDLYAFTGKAEDDDLNLSGPLNGDELRLRPPAEDTMGGIDLVFVLRRQ